MLPRVSIEPQIQYSFSWTNLAFACKTETLGSLYGHTPLILTKSSKSKNQVVHVVIWHFNLEHLHIIEVLMHANATIMSKDYRCSL